METLTDHQQKEADKLSRQAGDTLYTWEKQGMTCEAAATAAALAYHQHPTPANKALMDLADDRVVTLGESLQFQGTLRQEETEEYTRRTRW